MMILCWIWGSHSSEWLWRTVFWVIMPCSLDKACCFGETYCFQLYDWRVRQTRSQQKHRLNQVRFSRAPAVCLLGSCFNPEDGGNMFLQNIRLPLNYLVLQPRRPYSSITILLDCLTQACHPPTAFKSFFFCLCVCLTSTLMKAAQGS
jgi:hypothetical protein